MRVTLEIQGPIACGKSRLARFLDEKLREEYRVEDISFIPERDPVKETYIFDIFPQ